MLDAGGASRREDIRQLVSVPGRILFTPLPRTNRPSPSTWQRKPAWQKEERQKVVDKKPETVRLNIPTEVGTKAKLATTDDKTTVTGLPGVRLTAIKMISKYPAVIPLVNIVRNIYKAKQCPADSPLV